MRAEVPSITQVILDCCEALKRLMEEFHNFRKSKTIDSLIDGVLRLEEKCDEIYIKAVRDLFEHEKTRLKSPFGAICSIAWNSAATPAAGFRVLWRRLT